MRFRYHLLALLCSLQRPNTFRLLLLFIIAIWYNMINIITLNKVPALIPSSLTQMIIESEGFSKVLECDLTPPNI